MAINSGFFPSLNNDRIYNGYELGQIFKGIVTDGVFRNVYGAFEVIATSTPFKVGVKAGKAWINGNFIEMSGYETISVPSAGTCYVILQRDTSARTIRLTVSKSVPLSGYYLVLASVEVPTDGIITQSMITNLRGTSQCPFITGVLETLSADDILRQWKAQFDEFMDASETSFKNYVEKTTPAQVKARVDELWAIFKSQLQAQWDSWYSTNTAAFKKAWNDWYNQNTTAFKNDMDDFRDDMTEFKATWDVWWHEMTDGKAEELEAYWIKKQEELTSLMIKQWWEWYHPFVDEKEAEFANWKDLYDQKTAQVEIDYNQFKDLVDTKSQDVLDEKDAFTDFVNTKTQEVTDTKDNFNTFVDEKKDDVTNTRDDFNEFVASEIQEINAAADDGLEKIRAEIDSFYKHLNDILGYYTIPYTSEVTDSDGEIILDSDGNRLLSIVHVLVL